MEERSNLCYLRINIGTRPSISQVSLEVCIDCILQWGRTIHEIFGLKQWLFGERRSN